MTDEIDAQIETRLNWIIERQTEVFCTTIVQTGVAEQLQDDQQLADLIQLSVEIRHDSINESGTVEHDHDDDGGVDVPLLIVMVEQRLYRRAEEITATVCASIVRQDDQWTVADPNPVGLTDIHAMADAMDEARHWLTQNDDLVSDLDLTYPDRP